VCRHKIEIMSATRFHFIGLLQTGQQSFWNVALRRWVSGPEIEPLKMIPVPSVETSAMQRRPAAPSTSLHLIIIKFSKGTF